ncbi:Hypothetical protein A7982_02695 [Minicystis rosea]|nr:Hypothetical protein A7982_02695 [Minicystis rosea]
MSRTSGQSAVTGRPTAGARFALEKADETSEAVIYRGFVHLPDADVPATVTIELPGGATRTALGEGGSTDLEKTASALVRAATKALIAAHSPLPRKIVRWRG